MFRSTIGTCCKYTPNLLYMEKVVIAMAFELLANYLKQLLALFCHIVARYAVST